VIVSPYFSILLIAIGLGLIYLFRSRPSARVKKASRAIYADMTIAADVARASARQVFGVELDLSDKSIVALDKLISEGWTEPMEHRELAAGATSLGEADEEREIDINDSFYVLAGYLGTVLAYNHSGAWKSDDEHPLPYVYFKKFDYAVSPFNVIRKKLLAPQHFDLAAHYNNLLWELKQLEEGKQIEPVEDIGAGERSTATRSLDPTASAEASSATDTQTTEEPTNA
jgi:hypothetical protein